LKRIAYLCAIGALLIAALYSVRIGAITLAGALALFALPGIRQQRAIEQLAPIALIVSLITVALALPRR